jgi:putative isomerase
MLRREFLRTLSSAALAPALRSVLGDKHSIHERQEPVKESTISLDLRRVPFSCAGSYTTVTLDPERDDFRLSFQTILKAAITYRYQKANAWSNDLFQLSLMSLSRELTYDTVASAQELMLRAGNASATVRFVDRDTLLISATNCTVQLSFARRMSWAYQPSPEKLHGFDFSSQQYYDLAVDEGCSLTLERPQENAAADLADRMLVRGSGTTRVLVRITQEEQKSGPRFAQIAEDSLVQDNHFREWMKRVPAVPPKYSSAADVAWFLFWNLQVAPSGEYRRQTILSSKRVMSQIWSWDNCFNALAVVHADHNLAWDQIFVILDQQRANGLLPDTVNDYHPVFGFNKPPVWGWVLKRLIAATPEANRRGYVAEAYPRVAHFQRWWFAYRDLLEDGVPFYMHGNDSGWDNATIFDEGWPVQSPDLTTFLILQAEQLEQMALMLALHDEARGWKREAAQLAALFEKTFVRGDQLIYRVLTPQGIQERHSSSLLTRIPIVLGTRLSQSVRRALTRDLADEKTFFAPAGPASESLASSKYEARGYWRGPVWGPSTYLIHEGLFACGELALAQEIAERFCSACAREATFSENYNALTGEGQDDSGMTWSAADFLLLATMTQGALKG